MEYVFPLSEDPVALCLLQRPYGTVITVSVDDFSPMEYPSGRVRSHHIELEGGHATGDTNYRSHFFHVSDTVDHSEDWLVQFALEFAEHQFNKLHPKRQLEIF
ncbi:MAG: hypothetical protein JNL05_12970 [Flavobacteriales bacterium]|nr:hypothetical protein [Flavobacteriales bacterium]